MRLKTGILVLGWTETCGGVTLTIDRDTLVKWLWSADGSSSAGGHWSGQGERAAGETDRRTVHPPRLDSTNWSLGSQPFWLEWHRQ